jgi:hypothetical protein
MQVVVIWVFSSELIQFIFDDVGVSQPLFLTFYSTSLFSIYLLGFICKLLLRLWIFSCFWCFPSGRCGCAVFPSWRSNFGSFRSDGQRRKKTKDLPEDSLNRALISEISALEEVPATHFACVFVVIMLLTRLKNCGKCTPCRREKNVGNISAEADVGF